MSTELFWFVDKPDIAKQLIGYIAKRKEDEKQAFEEKCAELLGTAFSEEAHTTIPFDLVTELLQASEAVFTNDSKDDADIEGCFFVLCTLLLESEAKQYDLANEFCKVVTSAAASPVLRLKILTNLYNHAPESMRCMIFKHILTYAASAKQLHLIDAFLQNIGDAIKKWHLTAAESREFYFTLAQKCADAGNGTQAQEYLLTFLKAHERDNAASDEASKCADSARVKEAAAKVVIGAVKNIAVRQDVSLIRLKAVAQLKGDEKYGRLYELLRIFVSEKFPAYMEFYNENQAYVAELGVDHVSAVENMRLLSLCSLALEHDEIPYQVVAETLQIPLDQVEEYVLKAITMDLIDAKMDQLKKAIVVHSAMQRSFGTEQWKQMQSRLHQWKGQVESLLDVIKRRRHMVR